MAIIDELVVKLGLDASGFKKGEKEVSQGLDNTRKKAEKTSKDLEHSGKQGSEFFGQMQKAAIKFFAVLASARALTTFVSNTISMGANLSRVSRNLGVSANDLAKWGNAVNQSGGSMEEFLGTMQGISQQMTEIQMNGESAMTPLLNFLNVGISDAAGKAKDELQLILDIAEGLEKRGDMSRADKYNFLLRSGFDAGTANIILKGRKEAEAFVSKQVGMSDEMAKKLEQQEQRWEAVKQKVQDLGIQLFEKVLPAIESMSETLDGIFNSPGASKLAENFGKMADFAGRIKDAAVGAAQGYERMLDKMGLLNKDASGNTEAQLIQRAKAGDKEAARSLAKMQLENSWWHKLKGGYTEQDLQERIKQLSYGASKASYTSGPNAGNYDALFAEMGAKYGVDPAILKATALKENASLNPNAKNVNANGTVDEGLMQLNSRYHAARGVKDPYDVRQNVEAAAKLWADNLKRSGGDIRTAARMYNGSGAMAEKYADSWMSIYAKNGGMPTFQSGNLTGLTTAGAGRGNVNNFTLGAINIYPPNGDPKTIAGSIHSELVSQANSASF